MARCVICGRRLRTGRKYCYLHKGHYGRYKEDIKRKSDAIGNLYIWIVGVIVSIIVLYIVYIFLTFLIASFILPLICGLVLFFEIKKIKNSGIKSLSKKEAIIFSISTVLLFYSIYWWIHFFINGKTLV